MDENGLTAICCSGTDDCGGKEKNFQCIDVEECNIIFKKCKGILQNFTKYMPPLKLRWIPKGSHPKTA